MKTKLIGKLKVKAAVKAGGFSAGNHNRAGIQVKTSVKAGSTYHLNHNRLLALA